MPAPDNAASGTLFPEKYPIIPFFSTVFYFELKQLFLSNRRLREPSLFPAPAVRQKLALP